MTKLIRVTIVFAILNAVSIYTFAQSKDTDQRSSIQGKVKDSSYNFMLTSATIAVYKEQDSSLLQFSLPDNFGDFLIKSLPQNIALRLIITHVGYKTLQKKFTIAENKNNLNLGTLYLHQNADSLENMLEAVVIKAVPPMRMNGDTVEFNADAFRLNANSTAEDLMRMLPGFTVWGDGDITYNGKKINAVLVEGKPFMGSSDPQIATQNLPKEALDKIQVYQQHDEKNPLDSTLYANLKLKDDKKMGYFGKLSAGYGTDKRYTTDAMLSGFNKKIQVNIVGAANNINKLMNSTDMLVKNSSFKGEGTSMEYQSNFNMRGLNTPAAGGIKFQYDIVPEVHYRKVSRLNADYFISNNNEVVNNNNVANSFLEADTILSRSSSTRSNKRSTNQKLNSRYVWDSEAADLIFTTSMALSNYNNTNEVVSQQEKTGAGIISGNTRHYSSENSSRLLAAGVEYNNHEEYKQNQTKRIPKEFTIGYNFTAYDDKGSSSNQTSYTSYIDSSDNRVFDRLYERQDSWGSTHNITVRYPGLSRLFFNKRSFGGIQMSISSTYSYKVDNYIDKVLDKETILLTYKANTYLSNSRNMVVQNIQPSFNISKTFRKGLTNRYNKWISVYGNLREQYFSMDHEATQTIQNFAYSYKYFVPDASIEYSNHQFGSFEEKYSLNFLTSVIYPGVNNIAPLVDSSNIWHIPMGNRNIKPQYKKDISLGYTFNTRTSKNPLNLNFRVSIGQIDNNITDSSIYDKAGVRTVYVVNVDGNRYLTGEYGMRKSLEIKKNVTLEAIAQYNINIGQNPQYVNSLLNTVKNINHDILITAGFRLKDLLNLKAEQHFGIFNSKQQGFNNNQFKNTNTYTRVIGTLQFPKNLSWSSNITYNQSRGNNLRTVYFAIWNSSVTYRFLKGNNGEIKFSALDLLRQNKGIVNTTVGNVQTFSTSDVLQQYYMITLSYYPRQFGRKKENTHD